jgi:hypothetical protein
MAIANIRPHGLFSKSFIHKNTIQSTTYNIFYLVEVLLSLFFVSSFNT